MIERACVWDEGAVRKMVERGICMAGSGLLVGMVSTGLWHNMKSIQEPCQNADATSPHLSNLEPLRFSASTPSQPVTLPHLYLTSF